MRSLLQSVYRACYVLLAIKYAGRLYHKICPKTDYDYDNARIYILAYYPKDGPGLLVFKSTTICPEMLAWFRDFRDKLQAMVTSGTVKILTEAVPSGEIRLGATTDYVMGQLSRNLNCHPNNLANLITNAAMQYHLITAKYSGQT